MNTEFKSVFTRRVTAAVSRAEDNVLKRVQEVERLRQERGITMSRLSIAAGMGRTSYWNIVRTPQSMRRVKASTLIALEAALEKLSA